MKKILLSVTNIVSYFDTPVYVKNYVGYFQSLPNVYGGQAVWAAVRKVKTNSIRVLSIVFFLAIQSQAQAILLPPIERNVDDLSNHKKGFTLFLTGLSGAGKTTIAEALATRLMELQERKISLLDGDVIRQYLSNDLGFSKKDRSINVRRVGFVAQEITKHGGIALCSLISPYQEDRQHNRDYISSVGGYIEIYVATPLAVCEDRDPKGLYAKVREGVITNFTGIDDPYEVPQDPEMVIDTSQVSLEQAVEMIVEYLKRETYIS